MPPTDYDPALLRGLYGRWAAEGVDVTVGATDWLAAWVVKERPDPFDHRKFLEAQRPAVAAALELCEPDHFDAYRANRMAARIVLNAWIDAGDLVTAAAARQQQVAGWSGPVSAKPNGNGDGAAAEHLRDVGIRVSDHVECPPATVPTPFPDLTGTLAGGWRPGELIYIGARPSVGKSALATQFAVHAARHSGPVLIVSREMNNEAVARRMVAQAGVPAKQLRTGTGLDIAAFASTLHRLGQLPLWLCDRARGPEDIRAVAESVRVAAGKPLALVIVDYLQLLTPPKGVHDRRLQIEALSAGLRAIATELRVPLIALSSLARPGQSADARPTLASLRDSGALEHDADIVLLLHRAKDATSTACMVAKNRDGATGTCELEFQPDWVRFVEETTVADPDDEEGRYR